MLNTSFKKGSVLKRNQLLVAFAIDVLYLLHCLCNLIKISVLLRPFHLSKLKL
ncbi:hypothetical protein SAMN05880501_10880 [Ureibacillus xyleni]|uniref:Uncharacterized protein n=1 Tax=Ureibacillus xyleni TaxID=614648 RepID=A0A285T718_9BACL|nr:hypothetical protein SAMN05880501_10880 [Ureibacillus xyleni]